MAMLSPSSPPSSNGHERRSSPRRRRDIRVLFLSPDSVLDEPFGGWLVDASNGGLRLLTRLDDLTPGMLLYVRPPSAASGTSWVPVTVKNRRSHRGRNEIGCEFADLAPPPTRQLFAL